jgi:hypothetical protein
VQLHDHARVGGVEPIEKRRQPITRNGLTGSRPRKRPSTSASACSAPETLVRTALAYGLESAQPLSARSAGEPRSNNAVPSHVSSA